MEIVLIIITVCLTNTLCFLLGTKAVGSKVADETVIEPISNQIMERHVKKKNQKEEQKEQETLKTIMANIDNYDGTSLGQKDLPR